MINFGVGNIICRRTDLTYPTPSRLGICQDFELDIDRTLKELIGQSQFAIDVAQGQSKITGKIKFASLVSSTVNDLVFGQTITPASGEQMYIDEAHNGGATVTVTNSAAWVSNGGADMGVAYASTGNPLTRVAPASEATGKYSVVEATGAGAGVYTFGGTDVSGTPPLLFCYRTGVTSMVELVITNQLMGQGSSFELNAQFKYTNNAGTVDTMFLHLNACKVGKYTMPSKNTEYTVPSLDIQAFADTAGNIGRFSFNV